MDKLATENLFLLEFLVDKVDMKGKCDCDTPPGELCVSFQFLDNAPLNVCEADFNPNKKFKEKSQDNIKSGKSCLFSLTPEQVKQATDVFDVFVSIFKKMQPGWLPDKINVGNALISVSNLFVELIQSVETSNGETPSAKTLKDTFDVSDSTGESVGKIGIYIRMSCFGKLIVTQFQMNLDDKSVLFKDKEGQSLYRYKKARKGETNIEDAGANGAGRGNGCNTQCPQVPCFGNEAMGMGGGMGGMGGMGGGMGGMNGMPSMMPGAMPGMMPDAMGMNQGGFSNYPPNACCPMKPCFDDPSMFPPQQGGMFGQQNGFPSPALGQSMVPCSECNFLPQQQQSGFADFGQGGQQMFLPQANTPCIECGTLMSAPCQQNAGATSPPEDPAGNYQEIGAKMGQNALTIRVHKDKNKIEQIDEGSSEGSCCCTADNIGAKQKPRRNSQPTAPSAPQAFDMRPGIQQGDQNIPFSFKMSGAPGNNNVTVNPPVCTQKDGTQVAEISDPNKEVFVLRIGKKSEGAQKKSNLELELCTPRGPDLKPIPKKETRDCQYDPSDCKGEKGGKGKKGGKGGKGGKGKKGKKK